MMKLNDADLIVLLDGSNIALFECDSYNSKKIAKLSNIELIQQYLLHLFEKKDLFIQIITICDASIKYMIDEKEKLNQKIANQEIYISPAGTETDEFIFEILSSFLNKTIVISNDLFRETKNNLKKNKKLWRMPFMIINNGVFIPRLNSRLKSIMSNKNTIKNELITQVPV